MEHLLTVVTFLPLLGALCLAMTPRESASAQRAVALLASLACFACSVFLWIGFQPGEAGFQFVEQLPWIQFAHFQANYHLGLDGISLFLVLLTTFITPLAILGSWSIEKHVREYMMFMLVLETGVIGVFLSLDLLLFYLFWEVMLLPMYFLIGVWGSQNRIYAAIKFFLYTMFGSLLMLLAIICLYYWHGTVTGEFTFSYPQILHSIETGAFQLPVAPHQLLLFLAFAIAFAIKVPLFPFHTWLPDAHVEAPTAGSVILAAVLLKMGTYGFLRFCLPLFPEASLEAAPYISVLALVGIIYGALVAMVQPDLKKLIAYSSVSHLGYVVLGLFAFNIYGAHGATYQMLNHGLSTGALFLLVGMIYDRRHTRRIADFGGLARPMPVFTAFFLIATLSSIGLPGLNGFVGEILVLQGTFFSNTTYGILAASGMILSAVYMLWMVQRVFFGPVARAENQTLADMGIRERLILAPMVLVMVWMGVHSADFLRPMDASLHKAIARVQQLRQDRSLEPRLAARVEAAAPGAPKRPSPGGGK